MSPEKYETLPLIVLPGNDGHDPAGYTDLQQILLPYIDYIHTGWWGLFFATLLFVVTRFIVFPLFQDARPGSGR